MDIIRDVREAPQRWTIRILAAICVALALISAGLAWAWSQKADEAACWRSAFEEDDTRAAEPCANS